MPSFHEDTYYVFLQLKVADTVNSSGEIREVRQAMLEIACAAAKLKFPHFRRVVGIAINAPKFAGHSNSEDMLLMEFDDWSAERKAHYEEANRDFRFFATPQMLRTKKMVLEL